MTTVTLYHDVSHYQGNYKPTGPTVAKATEGTSMIDPEYAEIRARCAAAGDFFAAYHFLHPGNIHQQAAHAHTVIGRVPAMLDVESENGTFPSLADMVAFIDAYRALGGTLYGIYLPRWFWADEWHSPLLTDLKVRGCFTVASSYGHGYAPNAPGWQAYGGIKPSVLQYTATPIDNNAFYGTVAQLSALFNGGIVTTVDLSAASITALTKAITASVVAALPPAVWNLDDITNPPQRTDSPGHNPPGTNATIQADNALSFTVANTYTILDALAELPGQVAAAVGKSGTE